VKVVVNHGKELRAAFTVLAIFWSVAGLCYFFGWAAPAFIVAALGALAASERFFRVVANSPSLFVRIATSCVWLAVIAATFGLGVALLVPHGLSHAGS
jgi:hypothetical protein